MLGICFRLFFSLVGLAVSTCEGQTCHDFTSALQVRLQPSLASGTLPEFCTKNEKSTAQECLNECYDQEAAADKADADREMAWGIVGAVTGGAGDVFDAMPSKKKDNDLLQLSTNATAENKIIGMVVAGIGIAAGIGNAVSDREAAYASADSQNCELLGSLLMQGQLDLTNQKLDVTNQKLDVTMQKVDESLMKLDLVRQDIGQVKTIIAQVEERLTQQLDTLSSGQDALMLRVDETLQRINQLSLLNRLNALNTKMTEYFRCAGNVGHAFDTVQGAISDQETYKYGFKDVLLSGDASQAAEWQNRYKVWNSNLLPLLDSTAVHALEGMNCMGTLVSTGGLLESYYVELAQEFLRKVLEAKPNSRSVLDDVYELSTKVAANIFQNDEVLLVSLNAISQLRYILSAIPREGYWNDFAVYAKSLEVGFKHAIKYLETEHFMNLIRTGLADAVPVLFPPSRGCLTAMGKDFPQISSLSHFQTSGSTDILVASIETMVSLTEREPLHKDRGLFFDCTCNTQGSCNVAKRALPPGMNSNFGFSGHALQGSRRSTADEMARAVLRKMINDRKSAMAAWGCRAKDVSERSKAVHAFKSCLQGYSGPPPPVSCNFEGEDNTCGWTTPADGSLAWTHTNKRTPSSGTGPNSAAKGDYYMFSEATGNLNRVFNLDSPSFMAAKGFKMTFSYHMFGIGMNKLLVQTLGLSGTWKTQWEKSGDQGDSWKNASVVVHELTSKIRFKGLSGNDYRSDIAVDDIKTSAVSSMTAKTCLSQSVVSCPSSSCGTWLPHCRSDD